MLEYNKKKKGESEVPLGKTWMEKPKTGNLLTKLLPGEK